MLSFIQSYIGEQPRDILLGAADEVLISMKQANASKAEKLDEIKELLGDVSEDRYVFEQSGIDRISQGVCAVVAFASHCHCLALPVLILALSCLWLYL